MPEQAIMPTQSRGTTLGAGATPRAGFTMEDVDAMTREDEFKKKPLEQRSQMMETVLGSAFQDASRQGMTPEDHVAFGKFATAMRKRNDDLTPAKEKVYNGAIWTGEALNNIAADMGALAFAGSKAPMDLYRGRPDLALQTAETVGSAAVNKIIGRGAALEQWGKAHTVEGMALDTVLNDTLDRIDKGEHLKGKDPMGWLKAKADALAPLQEKYHAGGIDDPAALTAANRLDTPENTALLASYMATRNPQAKEQLKQNILRTGQRAAVAKDRESILKSPGAQQIEKLIPGSAEHLVNGSDPVNLLMMIYPFLRGAGAVEAGASTLSKVGSFAGQQAAFGIDAAITDNPSHPEYLKHIGEMALVGGTMHGAGMAVKAALGKGEEPPAAATPETLPTEPPPVPTTAKFRTFDEHGKLKATKELPHEEAMREIRGRESVLQKILDCLTLKLKAAS